MEEKVVVEFINDMKQTHVDLEIPLEITANDLVLALNEAYGLEMDTENIFSCFCIFRDKCRKTAIALQPNSYTDLSAAIVQRWNSSWYFICCGKCSDFRYWLSLSE